MQVAFVANDCITRWQAFDLREMESCSGDHPILSRFVSTLLCQLHSALKKVLK